MKGRNTYLGASDIGAALGFSQYRTPYELWQFKTGRGGEPRETGPMRRGKALEEDIIALLVARGGVRVDDRQHEFVHPDLPWMRAHVDGIITLADGTKWILECKAPGEHMFRIYRENGLPKDYVAQGIVCAGLAKLDPEFEKIHGTIYAVLDYENWDVTSFPVGFNPTMFKDVVTACEKFWGYVERDEPYDYDPPPVVKAEKGELSTFGGDEAEDVAYDLIQAKASKKAASEEYDRAVAMAVRLVGENETLVEFAGMVRMARPWVAGREKLDDKRLVAWANDVIKAYENGDEDSLEKLCKGRDIEADFITRGKPYRRATFSGIGDFKGQV